MDKPYTNILPFPVALYCLQANVTEFTTLEKVIRQGRQPDCPDLLYRYLDLADIFVKQQPREIKLTFYTHILSVLLDTICDTCIAFQWRQLCLDYCNKPLAKLTVLASNRREKQHVREQYSQFRTLTHYFC